MKFKKQNRTAKNPKMEVSDAVKPAQTGSKKNNRKRKTTEASGQVEVQPKMKKIEFVKPQTENKVICEMEQAGKVAPQMKKYGEVVPKIEMISSAVAKSQSVISKRNIRRRKTLAAFAIEEKKDAGVPDKDKMEFAIDYLKLWKNDRSAWKFSKLRQVWLNDHMLEESQLSDEMFQVYLEYMAGSVKRQKQFIVKKSENTLKELETNGSTADPQDSKYTRARKIIQSMDSGDSD